MTVVLRAEGVARSFALGSRLARGGRRVLRAVDGVSLEVRRGETLGLVGESGCGKSTLGRCLLRLIEPDSGKILIEGTEITALGGRALRAMRTRAQMVFQDPYASLNPRRRVGDLIGEPLRVHRRADGTPHTGADVTSRVAELAGLVGLSPEMMARYPHEFSGGQRQRIGIARALALSPALVIADEPVSALDVSVQAQVVNLMMDLQARLGLAYIVIAHDLSVVRQIAHRVAVMYLGALVEVALTEALYAAPAHPYTHALLAAVPRADPTRRLSAREVLQGEVPSPVSPPSGCRFHPRCSRADDRCRVEPPVLRALGEGRQVACHHPLAA